MVIRSHQVLFIDIAILRNDECDPLRTNVHGHTSATATAEEIKRMARKAPRAGNPECVRP